MHNIGMLWWIAGVWQHLIRFRQTDHANRLHINVSSQQTFRICVIFPFIGIKSYLYNGKIYQIGLNFWQHCLKRKKSSKQMFTFSTRPLSYLNNMWLTLKSKCYHWGYRVTKSSIFLSIEKVEKHPYFK